MTTNRLTIETTRNSQFHTWLQPQSSQFKLCQNHFKDSINIHDSDHAISSQML